VKKLFDEFYALLEKNLCEWDTDITEGMNNFFTKFLPQDRTYAMMIEKEPNRKELLAKAHAKGALCMQHVFVYVFYFVCSTNIYVPATENGIQTNNSGSEPDDPNSFDEEQDLLRAEL
jgi:hypothetical protein